MGCFLDGLCFKSVNFLLIYCLLLLICCLLLLICCLLLLVYYLVMLLNKLAVEKGMKPKLPPIFKSISIFIYTVIFIVTLHWSLHNLYNNVCIDTSYYGLIKHMFTMGSPFCHFINYFQYEISKNYVTLWVAAGVATVTYITNKILS